MREPRVVVVGSVNMDLSVDVPHLPRAGETVSGGDLRRGPGGKGANQAVAAQRLGARTTLVGRVGADEFGAEVRAALAAAGVDVSALGTVDGPTGTALIVVDPAGDNMITISPGANGRLGPGDHAGRLADADALLLQLEIPIGTCTAAARAARAANVLVVLNAAPLPHDPGDDLRELIRLADVLIVNEHEAEGLLGAEMASYPDPHNFVRDLRGLGPSEVVVTLGGDGAMYVGTDGQCEYVPAFPVDAIDAVGAGDAFCAAFTVARAAGQSGFGQPELGQPLLGQSDLALAVRRASAAGALTATRRGAQAALPTKAEVDEFLAQAGT